MRASKLIVFVRALRAFVARDFRLAISYRMQFVFQVVDILFILLTLFFVSKIFAGGTVSEFAVWRDPLAAWLTGLAVLNYFMTGFSSLANAVRQEQAQGTLEGVLMTPLNLPAFVVASSAFHLLRATISSLLYVFFGWLLFDVTFRGSFLLALAFLLLTTVVLAAIGVLSASFAMVYKRGDPFALVLGLASTLFSGVFFPTELISRYGGRVVGQIPRLLPPTYGLEGIRRVLIEGRGYSEVRGEFFALLCFIAVLVPVSLFVFGKSVNRAKIEGSLIQY